jgi:hypothetical protein
MVGVGGEGEEMVIVNGPKVIIENTGQQFTELGYIPPHTIE